MDICEKEAPTLQEVAPGHFVACHMCHANCAGCGQDK